MLKSYIIEFLGALFFIFVILATNQAIPIGLALMLAIMVGGNISGGHFNPAVTLTYFAQGKTPGKDVPWYILSQILGGLVALSIHKVIL
tara:strand:- start:6377 stop:6643 length:267 start_codon:yes stop_codon:yes gene_type:complete